MNFKLFWRIALFTAAAVGSVILAMVLVSHPVMNIATKRPVAKQPNYIYHFAVITPETQSFYWRSFERGAFAYARQNNIALEFWAPPFANVKEQEHFLEFVVLSKVDGIVTSVPEEQGFVPLIQQASDWGIPVVTLDSLAKPPSKYVQFVGFNPYEFGVKAGEALAAARHGQGNVAILIGRSRFSYSYGRILQGLNATLDHYPAMHLMMVLDSENGMISAEEQTYNILMNHPEIDTIFCTNSEDTEGATQVVLDLNRLTSVTLLGTGLTPELARYIRSGVIYGVLSTDPSNVGTRAIATLHALKEGNSSVMETEISLITAGNLDMFSKDYQLDGAGMP